MKNLFEKELEIKSNDIIFFIYKNIKRHFCAWSSIEKLNNGTFKEAVHANAELRDQESIALHTNATIKNRNINPITLINITSKKETTKEASTKA